MFRGWARTSEPCLLLVFQLIALTGGRCLLRHLCTWNSKKALLFFLIANWSYFFLRLCGWISSWSIHGLARGATRNRGAALRGCSVVIFSIFVFNLLFVGHGQLGVCWYVCHAYWGWLSSVVGNFLQVKCTLLGWLVFGCHIRRSWLGSYKLTSARLAG